MKTITIDIAGKEYETKSKNIKKRIIICAGTGCVANGALEIKKTLEQELKNKQLEVVSYLEDSDVNKNSIHVSKSGCQGFCQMGPLLRIEPDGILYVKVQIDDINEIISESIINSRVIQRLLFKDRKTDEVFKGDKTIPFYALQERIVLKNSTIDPGSIYEYIYNHGYKAAEKAYAEMRPEDICDCIEKSGLRGRGGGGFPTGKKWSLTLNIKDDKKFVICNGDEGDPGAFMDRSVMEGNPHSVIEGMMIAAKAIQASEGYVYVRAEYPLAVTRMKDAVRMAEESGIIGEKVFGKYSPFKIHVMEGAGAFVCGEETALIASIEGQRGMPRPKPPFPSVSGLYGKPTLINNVETLACIPYIILNGYEKFLQYGTASSPGTKTFALTGHIANTGLIEVPFGTTLRKIIFDIGGGVINNKGELGENNFKAVQIGGPSGGCLTPEMLDLPLDFDSLKKVNAMVGSGGLVVMNKETCMVSIARFFMKFTQNESCGKCVPCREGTRQMLGLLDDIINGNGTQETLDLLERVAVAVQKGSLCGLGKTAPNPVISTMKYFRDEYISHVKDKVCPAKACKAFAKPEIEKGKCIGCGACKKKCPVHAITGEIKTAHHIDQDKCIKCGICKEICKFDAISGF